MALNSSLLVTGANGLLGTRIIQQLSQLDYQITAIGRNRSSVLDETLCDWYSHDLSSSVKPTVSADILIHCAPLWLLPGFLSQLIDMGGIKRCIAFSSTSAISKAHAADAKDRLLAEKLSRSESEVRTIAADRLNLTLLRPTMIYGYTKDKNITVIASQINKFGFFPLVHNASGLRQPVHVDDLVKAVVDIVDNEKTYGETYNLAGSETLTYQHMVNRIFTGLGKPTRFVRLPVSIYRFLLFLRGNEYSKGVADRMRQDLNFDIQKAVTDFNYQAQAFLEHPKRDLP